MSSRTYLSSLERGLKSPTLEKITASRYARRAPAHHPRSHIRRAGRQPGR
ncbi:hypothetical protein [Pseudomonas capeferrum]